MGVLFNEILDMSFKAIWLILTVIFVRILFQKLPKYIRCILWALVAIRLVCPFSIESAFSLVPLVTYTQDEVSDNSSDSKVELLDENSVVPENNSQIDEISEQENYIAEDDGSVNKTDDTESTNNNIANTDVVTENIYSIIWLFGMLAILTHSVISYIRLKTRIGTCTNYDDIIWICDAVETPFILGIIKPRIYLPSNMDGEIKKYVLAHEYAHIRRKDHIWKPLGFFIVCIHWFNPLVWVAYVLFSRDIEMACDEKVIKNYDVEERKAYSKALLACSASNRPTTECPVAFSEVGVKGRVKSVLNYKKPAFWIIAVALIICAFVAVGFMTDPKDKILECSLINHREQWWLDAIGWSDADRIEGVTGKGVTIALLDTAIDSTHPDIRGKIIEEYKVDDISGEIRTEQGTAFAGIICASPNDTDGVLGVAEDAEIVSVVVKNAKESKVEWLIDGIEYAISKNVDIINISEGFIEDNIALKAVIDKAYNAGIVIIAASGYDGYGRLLYPAAYENVISVNSVDTNGVKIFGDDDKSVFLPGGYIVTTYSSKYEPRKYIDYTGTSTSAAIMTGVVALAIDAYPDVTNEYLVNYFNHLGQRTTFDVSTMLFVMNGVYRNDSNTDYKGFVSQENSNEAEPDVELEVSDVSATGLTLKCSLENEEFGMYSASNEYYLERYESDTWIEVEMISTAAFTSVLPFDGEKEWKFDWEDVYGELDAGRYRLAKPIWFSNVPISSSFGDKYIFYKEFTILDNMISQIVSYR